MKYLFKEKDYETIYSFDTDSLKSDTTAVKKKVLDVPDNISKKSKSCDRLNLMVIFEF